MNCTDVACREPASEYGYDPSVLALHRHPLFVVGYAHGGEADLHAQLIALEKKVFHNVAGAVGSGAEQYAQRQGSGVCRPGRCRVCGLRGVPECR